jgi:hypothetical protein
MGGSLSVSNFTVSYYQHPVLIMSGALGQIFAGPGAVDVGRIFKSLTIHDGTNDLMDLAGNCAIARKPSRSSS